MKITFVTIVALFALSYVQSAVIHFKDPRNTVIGKFRINPVKPYGYHFEYETSSGLSRRETGVWRKSDKGINVLRIIGFYNFKTPNNEMHHVDYTADENGYHPVIKVDNSEYNKDKIYFPNDSTSTPLYNNEDLTTTVKPDANLKTKALGSILKDSEGVGNRFDLPPELIGSLLG